MNTCRCGNPTGAYACEDCATQTHRDLGDTPWLIENLDITITKQRGIDYRAVGGGKGGKVTAASTKQSWAGDQPSLGTHVQADLVHWAGSEARADLMTAMCKAAAFCWTENIRHQAPTNDFPETHPDNLSRWLIWRIDGLTLHPDGPRHLNAIMDAAKHAYRAIDNPPDKWYAGPCNDTSQADDDTECGADLYANAATGNVTCPKCGAIYDVPGRRTWLLQAAEDRLADAATLARSVSWLGTRPLNAARVRKWAERGRITAKTHLDGRPLYRIGDAIDLLAKEAS